MTWFIRIIPIAQFENTRLLTRNANIVAKPEAGNHKVAGMLAAAKRLAVLTREWCSWFVKKTDTAFGSAAGRMQDAEIFNQDAFDGSRACSGRGACRADDIRIRASRGANALGVEAGHGLRL